MPNEPEPRTEPVHFAQADAGRLVRLCPYCGGKLSEYADTDSANGGNGSDAERGRREGEPEFCCTYQRDEAQRQREAAKRRESVDRNVQR